MKTNFLKKIFYLPNYLSLPTAGVEISNRSIKYIEFFNKKSALSIRNFGEVFLEPNTIKDGDIYNRNALVKALIEVKNKISSDFVRVSIPEEKTYVFDIQLPKEASANIREALEFKIEENVPLKLDEVVFEYETAEDKKMPNDMILNVSVIPKKVIADYTEIFGQAGIYPLSFEIESKMIASSVIPKGDKRNSIIVDIKDDSTVFVAVIDGFVRTTATVAIGESAIRETLSKSGIFADESAIDKYFQNDFSFETSNTKESYLSLINIFSILKDEVEKFDDYVTNKFPNAKNPSIKNIDRIILCGRSSILPGLSKHINQKINAEIILANAWSNVFITEESSINIKFIDSLAFVTPIGLAISSYKK